MQSKELEDLVKTVTAALVDKPDEVEINTITGQTTWVMELKVAKDDVGKVIGREGKTASAIRTIVNAIAGKARINIVLQIVEPARQAA